MSKFSKSCTSASEENLNDLVEIVRQQIFEKIDGISPRTDFEFLAKFIRAKKYNTEGAISAICKYYDSIQTRSDLFKGIRASEFTQVFNSGALKLLKSRVNNVKVLCVSFQNWDPHNVSLEKLTLAIAFCTEEALKDKDVQIHGGKCIVDLSGLSFKHARALTYTAIQFSLKLGTDTFPLRIAGIHYLSVSRLFWPVFKIASKFYSYKIRQRITFHRGNDGLDQIVPPEILPKSLGGYLNEDEAWDQSWFRNLIEEDTCYDSYWSSN